MNTLLESPRLNNFEGMRQWHLELLEKEPEPLVSEMQNFLREGSRLGTRIGTPKLRAEAQGMLNYWAANLARHHSARERLNSSADVEAKTFGISGFVTLATYDDQVVKSAYAEGLAKVKDATPQQREEIQKVIPWLLRMDSAGNEVRLADLDPQDPALAPGGVDSAGVKLLKEAGFLVPAITPGYEASRLSLVSETLLKEWDMLEQYQKQRRAFRETVRGWDRGGRQSEGGLVSKQQIALARSYHDHNAVETAYLEAADGRSHRVQNMKFAILGMGLVMLAIFVTVLINKNRRLDEETARAKKAEAVATNQTIAADVARGEAVKALVAAREAEKKATDESLAAKAARDSEAVARSEAEKARDDEKKAKEEAQNSAREALRLKNELEKEQVDLIAKQKSHLDILNRVKSELEAIARNGKAARSTLERLPQLAQVQTAIDSIGSILDSTDTMQRIRELQVDGSDSAATVVQAVVEQRAEEAPQRPKLVQVLQGHDETIMDIAFSPDGDLATAGEDRNVRVWNPNGELLRSIDSGSADRVNCLAFSPGPENRRLAIGSNGGQIRMFDFASGNGLDYKGHRDSVTSVVFSHDGSQLLSSSGGKVPTVQVWDPTSLNLLRILSPNPLPATATSAVFDEEGKQIVASLDDPAEAAYLWNDSSDTEPKELKMGSSVRKATFSRDGKLVVTAGYGDNTARIWSTETKQPVGPPLRHQAAVFQAVFSPDGTRVATASADLTAKIWNTADGSLIATLRGHKGEVRQLRYSPSGDVLLTGASDATAKLWFKGETTARYTLTGHTRRVTSIAFNKDGTQIATGSYDGTVRLYNFTAEDSPPPAAPKTGWALYGWLETKSEETKLRAQSFTNENGLHRVPPKVGDVVKAEATMNVRDLIRQGEDKVWNQGKPVDILRKGDRVKVLKVLGVDPAERGGNTNGVWIQFEKL